MTQWVQAKLDKLVTSLSQLLINYYRVKMNVHQTIKTSRPKADHAQILHTCITETEYIETNRMLTRNIAKLEQAHKMTTGASN